MNPHDWKDRAPGVWEWPRDGAMRVPGVLYASRELLRDMDDKVTRLAPLICVKG